MQITLDQDEIHDALKDYVRQRISIKENQHIEIDLKNGRGENGTTAIINITSANSTRLVSSVSIEDDDDDIEVSFNEHDDVEDSDELRPALFG